MLTIDKTNVDEIIDGLLGNNDLTASPEVWYGLHQIKNLIATEIIYCHECKYWKDSDGVYRRGINAESKCPVNSRQVYEGTFFCGRAERRTE